MNDIKRGEMFYISRGGASYNGSEQHADRPAVVVSNNKNNENSNVVEVVYMTTQPKTDLPTHVTIRSTGRISTVLCEQVYSVSTERIGTYIGEATDKEMENIDIALMISLQLDNGIKTAKEYYKTIKEQQEEIDSLKKEIEMLQQEHEDTIAEIEQDAAVYVEENKKIANMTQTEDTIRLQTERDTYKTMYEQLILAAFIFTVVMIFVFLRMGSEPSTLIENVFRFLSVEGGAMALIKSVKTVKGTKSNGEIQHNDEPEQDDEEVQG